jgi:hypothetical protein
MISIENLHTHPIKGRCSSVIALLCRSSNRHAFHQPGLQYIHSFHQSCDLLLQRSLMLGAASMEMARNPITIIVPIIEPMKVNKVIVET